MLVDDMTWHLLGSAFEAIHAVARPCSKANSIGCNYKKIFIELAPELTPRFNRKLVNTTVTANSLI